MDPTLLIIIVFIIAPLIERLLKAGKQGPGQFPPEQRPPQRMPPEERPSPRSQHERQHAEGRSRVVIRREEDDAAATMLPDDLWEILTGEKRAPAPPPQAEPVEWDEEEQAEDEEEQSLEMTSAGEWISLPPEPEPAPPPRPARPAQPAPLPVPSSPRTPERARRRPEVWRNPELHEEGYVRPLPVREPPQVVSLEALEIDDEMRHDEFHRRLDASQRRVRTPSAHRFTSDDDLRRAIIMSEILGRPKGLE